MARRPLSATALLLVLAACAAEPKAEPAPASTPAPAPAPAPSSSTPGSAPAPAPAPSASVPAASENHRAPAEPPSRATMKVRFGAQPGYDYDGEGVEVEGVSEGSSAEAAGVQEGDVLKTWNGKKIDDIYKWMEYLAAANPGDVVEIGVLRKGEMKTLKATLKPAE